MHDISCVHNYVFIQNSFTALKKFSVLHLLIPLITLFFNFFFISSYIRKNSWGSRTHLILLSYENFLLFWGRASLCHPGWSAVAWSQLTPTSISGFKWFSYHSLLSSWDYRHAPSCSAIFLVFLVEMVFHHVGQTGLELLTANDPPTSDSQSTGITGVSHCAQPSSIIFKY